MCGKIKSVRGGFGMRNGFLCDENVKMKIMYFSGFSVMTHAHVHSQWELYFCPDRVWQSSVINGVSYDYRFPCAILSRPYTIHSMSCAEERSSNPKWERYVFYFSDETVKAFGEEIFASTEHQGILFELTEEQAGFLKDMLELIIRSEFESSDEEQRFFLGFFISKLFSFCKNDKITKVGATSFYVQDVMKYIAESLSEPENTDTLARRFAVSRSKLDRDFKEALGMSVHDFANVCRLNYAKSLLRSGSGMTVSAVSEACGFKSETYFFSFFKKHTGFSPTEFKQLFNRDTDKEIFSACE